MTDLPVTLANGIVPALKSFVNATKLHPVLVNFTAALVPVSIASDLLARVFKSDELRATGWWTLLLATIVTPFTAIAGWLFWMDDDNGVRGMTIHKWLGTALAVLLVGLFLWRGRLRRKRQWATAAYLALGMIFIVALVYQGYLGGTQVFSDM